MKISRGRLTFIKSLKKYPLVSVLLSWSGHLFQYILQVKYRKVLSSHTLIIAALYEMAWPNSLVRNFKNFKIVLSELSPNLAMILVPDFFSLGLDNLSDRRAKQKANLMYKCINNLAPAYLCNLFAPRTPNYYFRNAKKKLMLPKPRTDYLKCSFSYSGALLWNNLPEEIRTSNSLGFFKRSSHRWFSDQYSHTANM